MNKRNKKIALWGVIILVVILCVPLSYAAYTSVTSARRVVSTANAADSLFSSNYLALLPKDKMESNGNTDKYKNIPISYQTDGENTTQAAYVSVCNYAQGYLTKWSDKDINYRITFSLVDLETHQAISENGNYTDKGGNEVKGSDILDRAFTVAEGIATLGKETIPNTYSGKSLLSLPSSTSQNMYTVFLDTTYADIVGVKIEVITEDNSPAYSGYGLGGVLCLSGYASATASGWNGEIQEAPASGATSTKNSSDYTGFNYEVSGSGAGTVTVTWNKDKFAISNIFLEDMKDYITTNDLSNGSISFKVGEANEDDRFFIQFYRVSQPATDEIWNTIKADFTCAFEKAESNDGESTQ